MTVRNVAVVLALLAAVASGCGGEAAEGGAGACEAGGRELRVDTPDGRGITLVEFAPDGPAAGTVVVVPAGEAAMATERPCDWAEIAAGIARDEDARVLVVERRATGAGVPPSAWIDDVVAAAAGSEGRGWLALVGSQDGATVAWAAAAATGPATSVTGEPPRAQRGLEPCALVVASPLDEAEGDGGYVTVHAPLSSPLSAIVSNDDPTAAADVEAATAEADTGAVAYEAARGLNPWLVELASAAGAPDVEVVPGDEVGVALLGTEAGRSLLGRALGRC